MLGGQIAMFDAINEGNVSGENLDGGGILRDWDRKARRLDVVNRVGAICLVFSAASYKSSPG